MRKPAVLATMAMLGLIAAAEFEPAMAQYQQCARVTRFGFDPASENTAGYNADRALKRKMAEWRAKGYKPKDGTYVRDCARVPHPENRTELWYKCSWTILMCKTRS